MSCQCGSSCNECTPYVVYGKGLQGDPGPAPSISIGITVLPAGSEPTVVATGVSPVLHYQLGIPAQALPLFSVVATTLAPGTAATASINNANPFAPVLTLGIPRGANGLNGFGTAFTTLDAFAMPAPGGTTGFVTIGDNRMVEVGTWVKSEGVGSWFIVAAKSGDDQVQLRNPGGSDLLPYWGVGPTSIPTNAATGTPFIAGEKFVVVGAPGLRGLAGATGVGVSPVLVTGVPLSPPAQPSQTLALAADSFVNPTWVRFYTWNGVAWLTGPSVLGPRGANIFFGSADPNTAPPSGAAPGDVYTRQNGTALQYWTRGGSSWSLVASFALQGSATQTTVQGGPGNFPIDLGVFSHEITADKPIQLNWDSTNYAGQGQWTVAIENIDGSPIALTYAAGRWEKDPALTLPSTIGAGDTVIVRFVQNPVSGLYAITSIFEPVAV